MTELKGRAPSAGAGKRLRGSRPGELNGSGSNGRTYPSPGGGKEAVSKRAERVTGAADAIRPDQLDPRKSADFRCWSVVIKQRRASRSQGRYRSSTPAAERQHRIHHSTRVNKGPDPIDRARSARADPTDLKARACSKPTKEPRIIAVPPTEPFALLCHLPVSRRKATSGISMQHTRSGGLA